MNPIKLILLLFITLPLLAQNKNTYAPITIKDSIAIDSGYNLAASNANTNPRKAATELEKVITYIDSIHQNTTLPHYYALFKKAESLHHLAYFKRRERENPLALEYLQKSITIKEQIQETFTLCTTYHQIGWVWIYQFEYDKAEKYLDIAYELSIAHDNFSERIKILSTYGELYRNMKKIDKALASHQLAMKLADSIQDPKSIAITNSHYASLLRQLKRYDENEKHLKIMIDNHKRMNNLIGMESGTYALGVTYREQGKFVKAIEAHKEALKLSEEIGNKALIHSRYLAISSTYKKAKDFEQALDYYKKYHKAILEKTDIETYKKLADLESKHTYEKQAALDSIRFAKENEKVIIQAESQKTKKNLYFVLLLVVLSGAAIVVILLRKNHNNKTRLTEERLEREKAEKEFLDEKLKINEEETKRVIADNTMRLAFKQELLNKLKKEVGTTQLEALKNSLNSTITELQLQINTEEKLGDLQNRIEEVNKGFDLKLIEQYPSLTKTEREICSLLRLNLSIKEIMTIRNVSLDSVKSARYRIRKKMEVPSGEELEAFIQNIR